MTKARHTIRRFCGLVLVIAPFNIMLWGVFQHGIIAGIITLAKVGWFTLAMSAPIMLGAWLLFPMPPIGDASAEIPRKRINPAKSK